MLSITHDINVKVRDCIIMASKLYPYLEIWIHPWQIGQGEVRTIFFPSFGRRSRNDYMLDRVQGAGKGAHVSEG